MALVELAVVARASTDRVGPFADGVLRVRVTKPAANGQANRAVLRLLADALDVPRSGLELVAGERGRRKRVRVAGLGDAELARRLAGLSPN